jgi:DNA-binding response OmpR family regulator
MARVLLATDPGPPHTRAMLRAFLQSAGHEVHEIRDGAAVLDEVQARQPALLVLDTALPTYDGFQVLARLRTRPATQHVPVIVLSSIPTALGSHLVYKHRPAVYLRKPPVIERLAAAIEQLLHSALHDAPRDQSPDLDAGQQRPAG